MCRAWYKTPDQGWQQCPLKRATVHCIGDEQQPAACGHGCSTEGSQETCKDDHQNTCTAEHKDNSSTEANAVVSKQVRTATCTCPQIHGACGVFLVSMMFVGTAASSAQYPQALSAVSKVPCCCFATVLLALAASLAVVCTASKATGSTRHIQRL